MQKRLTQTIPILTILSYHIIMNLHLHQYGYDQSNKKLDQIPWEANHFNFQNQEGKWINQNDLFGRIYIANFSLLLAVQSALKWLRTY